MHYLIRRATTTPEFRGDWDGPAWGDANVGEIAHFHATSSDHRPRTRFKLLYDDAGIYAIFHVADRYVKCVYTEHQQRVWKDSCVEFFVQPTPGGSYFNIETNCGGTMLLYCIEDQGPSRSGKLERFQILPPGALSTIRIHHSLPRSVPIEITEPTDWTLEYFVPYALFERYMGPLKSPAEREWRGNFYKCADETSHPHWASWSPIERLDFHQTGHFAPLTFEVGAADG
ncbi:MAG: carbohydrate-binding family 9-like protein [Tepidisphaeraceae bacterium]